MAGVLPAPDLFRRHCRTPWGVGLTASPGKFRSRRRSNSSQRTLAACDRPWSSLHGPASLFSLSLSLILAPWLADLHLGSLCSGCADGVSGRLPMQLVVRGGSGAGNDGVDGVSGRGSGNSPERPAEAPPILPLPPQQLAASAFQPAVCSLQLAVWSSPSPQSLQSTVLFVEWPPQKTCGV